MHNSFTLKRVPAIHFAPGSIHDLPHHAGRFGSRLLILTGAPSQRQTALLELLGQCFSTGEFQLLTGTIETEPGPDTVDEIVSRFRNKTPQAVIGIGGGSVIDAGKAVSAMLPGGEPVQHYLEGVGHKLPDGRKIPFIAVPTTAGTGSEVTSNAVISKTGKNGYKKSLRHDHYIPDAALIDPELMCSCPPHLTAACGMDTFTQLVEGYLSSKASVISDAIAWSGLEAIQRSLLAVYHDGSNVKLRADMAYASLCSGIVLTNAGLGIIHGMAPPLGSLFPIPHGVACGSLMAAANEKTLSHVQKSGIKTTLAKYQRLGSLFCPAAASDGRKLQNLFIDKLYQMTSELKLGKLSDYGMTEEDINEIAMRSELKNNPVSLSLQAIGDILNKSI